MTSSVAILAFDQMEALDFAGPFEVLTAASRVARGRGLVSPFAVSCVADSPTVRARAGLTLQVDHHFSEMLKADLVVVPGGVTSAAEGNEALTAWLIDIASRAQVVASVCTGVFILAAAGIVTTHEVTTHWEDADELATRYPDLRVRRDVRWVDEGSVVTSAGISAGIDMSLHLVARLASDELAVATARQMEYDWRR